MDQLFFYTLRYVFLRKLHLSKMQNVYHKFYRDMKCRFSSPISQTLARIGLYICLRANNRYTKPLTRLQTALMK